MNKQKGNAVIWIIVILIIVLGIYFLTGNNKGVPADENLEENTELSENNSENNEETSSASGEEAPVDGILEQGEFFLVDYTDEGFVPKEITIKKGGVVRFVNNSSGDMWVGSAIHPTHAVYPLKSEDNCLGSDFDQCETSSPGTFWEFTFDIEGEHGYHNHVKASDWGRVVVE